MTTTTQPKVTIAPDNKSYTIDNDPGYINTLDTTQNRFIRSAIPAATPAAPVVPSPGATPTPVDRLVRTPSTAEAAVDTSRSTLSNYYSAETPKTLEQIRAEKQKTAQSSADLITNQFNQLITQDRQAGDERNAVTRAQNVTSGLSGSSFGDAAAIKTEDANKKVIQAREQERDAKVAAILAGVDESASEEYAKQRETTLENLKGDLDLRTNYLNGEKQKAVDSIKGLAGQGITIDTLKTKEPSAYDALIKQYGGSQVDLETAWNDALPDDKKVKYQDTIIEGPKGNAQILRYGVNPTTNTIDKKVYDLDTDYNQLKGTKTVTANGRIYRENADGSLTALTDPVVKTTTTKPLISGKLSLTAEQLAQGESTLQKSKGKDGYVDPTVYQAAYDQWVNAGGLAKDFLSKFAPNSYVNPENDWLPQYLRSTTKGGKKDTGRSL